jgi:hypothetical protein
VSATVRAQSGISESASDFTAAETEAVAGTMRKLEVALGFPLIPNLIGNFSRKLEFPQWFRRDPLIVDYYSIFLREKGMFSERYS